MTNYNNAAYLQKMQKDLMKKMEEFGDKEFDYDYMNGSVVVKITGNLKILSLNINETLIDPTDKITLQEMIAEAINEAIEAVNNARQDLMPSIPGLF
ncbi:MAG: YbaB/EbfC family nucleoid-associated protein [Malacoplasma sp.]|nr:YbaB/EbfC family nucleoid-associated protein [Mycoplasmataceae bacterium]MDD7685856.1 YbaB/EbfC family nucleoid-associated protein [Mycoplasmataceae bacterium]MDY2887162.1 YbaB/EbfC family nucleoid-associated protein [Malacoplasma sp.]